MTLSADIEQTHRVRSLIEELLADPRQLGPDYQPVVPLADGEGAPVAVKATGRGRPGTALADTLALLESAQSLGLVERLDWAFRALAFEDLLTRPELELHLTPEPETFGTMCPPRLAGLVSRARRELRIAAEIHAETFADPTRLRGGVAEIRDWGWRVVVADIGDDPAALEQAGRLHPDVVQIDYAAADRLATAPAAGVRRLQALAAADGAQLMAINADTPAARDAALAHGCVIARGGQFGAPGDLAAVR